MENDIIALIKQLTKKLKSNLTHKKDIAMEKKRDHIASNADKGGTVVIMATDNCIKETNWQISGKANYKELTEGTTLQHNRIQTKERFKNEKLLPKKTADNFKNK